MYDIATLAALLSEKRINATSVSMLTEKTTYQSAQILGVPVIARRRTFRFSSTKRREHLRR